VTYVADDSELSECVEYSEPDADVLTALSHWTSSLTDKLVRVQSDLQPVVEQREQRSQRERSHEYRYEAEL